MDQETLVADEIVDGRRFIERFAADGNPIRAAAWIKTDDEDYWALYIATELYDREGPLAAYQAVHASLEKLDDLLFSSSPIHLIGVENAIARDLMTLATRHPKRSGFSIRISRLGPMIVDKAYVYSPYIFDFVQAGSMTVEDVGQEILRLLMRGPGPHQPSRVQLKDGTTFQGVPLTLHLGDHDTLRTQFATDSAPSPREVLVGDIAFIH